MRKMLFTALLTLSCLTFAPTTNAGLIPVYDAPYYIVYEPTVVEVVSAEDDGSYKPPPPGEDGQWTPDTSEGEEILVVEVDTEDEKDTSKVDTTEAPETTTENAGIPERSTDCGPDGEDGEDGADGDDGPDGSKGGKGGKGGKAGKGGCPGKGGDGGDAGNGGDAPVPAPAVSAVESPTLLVVNDLVHDIVIE